MSEKDLRLPNFPRGKEVAIDLEGRSVRAFENEPVAVGLFGSGIRVLSRSAKYHRPRSLFCLSGHCGSCLLRIDGVPNVKSCMTPCREGLRAERQNAWPNARVDVLGMADLAFAGGFNPHTFMTRPAFLNRWTQKMVRPMTGLGRLPSQSATPILARTSQTRLLVVGGGPAGLSAASAAAEGGAQTLLIDDQDRVGGRLLADPCYGIAEAMRLEVQALTAGVTLRSRTSAFGFFPEDGGVIGAISDAGVELIRAERIIVATGGYEQNAVFPGNDLPGVISARAVGRLLVRWGIRPGRTAVVAGQPGQEEADGLALALQRAGATVERTPSVVGASGRAWVRRVKTSDGRETPCDLLAVCEATSPASELARQLDAEVRFSESGGGFAVATSPAGQTRVPYAWACGDVCGAISVAEAADRGAFTGHSAALASTPRFAT